MLKLSLQTLQWKKGMERFPEVKRLACTVFPRFKANSFPINHGYLFFTLSSPVTLIKTKETHKLSMGSEWPHLSWILPHSTIESYSLSISTSAAHPSTFSNKPIPSEPKLNPFKIFVVPFSPIALELSHLCTDTTVLKIWKLLPTSTFPPLY